MRVKARILDAQHQLLAEEILELSDPPMYGRSADDIETIVSMYVNAWAMKHITIQYDIIDTNSGQYPFIDGEKR